METKTTPMLKSISEINTNIPEGRYLMAAIAKLAVESQRDKTPDEVLSQCHELQVKMYEDKPQSTTDMQPELKQAVDKLREALKADPDYYRSWQANIAMAFQDEMERSGLKEAVEYSRVQINKLRKFDGKEPYSEDVNMVHLVANTAADNFLQILIS